MSSTILGRGGSWVATFSNVIDDLGVTSANIFGGIWGFCQMENGRCTAGQKRIASKTGYSRRAVQKHADRLVDNGYLRKEVMLGKGVVYYDTGKASSKINVDLRTTCATPANDVRNTCAPRAHKDTLNIPLKEIRDDNGVVIIPDLSEESEEVQKIIIARQKEKEKMAEEPAGKLDMLDGMIAYQKEEDTIVDNFPEDVVDIIKYIKSKWLIEPNLQLKGNKAFWIVGARDLKIACGVYPWKNVLSAVYQDYYDDEGKYTVSSPKSLLQVCLAKVAEFKGGKAKSKKYVNDGSSWL